MNPILRIALLLGAAAAAAGSLPIHAADDDDVPPCRVGRAPEPTPHAINGFECRESFPTRETEIAGAIGDDAVRWLDFAPWRLPGEYAWSEYISLVLEPSKLEAAPFASPESQRKVVLELAFDRLDKALGIGPFHTAVLSLRPASRKAPESLFLDLVEFPAPLWSMAAARYARDARLVQQVDIPLTHPITSITIELTRDRELLLLSIGGNLEAYLKLPRDAGRIARVRRGLFGDVTDSDRITLAWRAPLPLPY